MNFQVDQAETEDQGFLRRLEDCRVDPEVERLDRLLAAGVGQAQDQCRLEISETLPFSPNHGS